jgi:hypothetical protein
MRDHIKRNHKRKLQKCTNYLQASLLNFVNVVFPGKTPSENLSEPSNLVSQLIGTSN